MANSLIDVAESVSVLFKGSRFPKVVVRDMVAVFSLIGEVCGGVDLRMGNAALAMSLHLRLS